MGFDLNPHHSTTNTPRPSVTFKKQLYQFPSSLVDSPVAAVEAEEEEERSTRQSMMVWDLNTPNMVFDRYRLISILVLFNGERTLSAVVKGLPPSPVNYAIDIVVFLLRYTYDDDDEYDYEDVDDDDVKDKDDSDDDDDVKDKDDSDDDDNDEDKDDDAYVLILVYIFISIFVFILVLMCMSLYIL
jgi:hypothetical protein